MRGEFLDARLEEMKQRFAEGTDSLPPHLGWIFVSNPTGWSFGRDARTVCTIDFVTRCNRVVLGR